MKLESIDIEKVVEKTKKLINEDKDISSSLKATIELLLVIVTLLINIALELITQM